MAGGQRPKRLNKSCFLLIVIAGIERFAFKGVASNLVTYLTDIVKMSNSGAAKSVNNWCGFTSLLPLLVASLADSCDRYTTILASSFLYVVGLVALTSTSLAWSWYPNNSISSSFLFLSLCLISLGQGGYNPSLQAFGADQLKSDDELPCTKDSDQKSNKKTLFFHWWYFGVCGGSLLGVTLMSYIQDTFGWVLGFAIPTIAMFTSIAVFWSGSRIYIYMEERSTKNKPPRNVVQAIRASISGFTNCKITLSDEKSKAVQLELEEKPLCQDADNIRCVSENPETETHLLDNARALFRLVPIWAMLLMFAVIFQQPATFFTKQGVTMKRNIGSSFKIPPATLQSAITVSIILLMPFYDAVFIPILRVVTNNEKGINVMQRMGIGMVLSIIAMVIAALVESRRLEMSQKLRVMEPEKQTVPLSIFWLLPQYILLGISDIFTVVGMQEFFYSEVPVEMKTMGIALYTSVFGVGSFLSSLLISTIEVLTKSGGRQSWFCDDMRESHLDYYYWLLAFLSGLSLLFYTILSKFYKSRGDLDCESCK
ncbi:hypothetical protein K2173_020311 [Erythroxylum novogranatense]|uniref:Uncharacterized protein n=1 Tax=Erythroxylum novogranatense TaxID=1862640 RepID=A0AAV8U7G8_9ROSI|nr:hypothetical protein K2173_020311 [Erythroxylum novogranatense]